MTTAERSDDVALEPGDQVILRETNSIERVQYHDNAVARGLVLEGVPGFYEAGDVLRLPDDGEHEEGVIRLYADRDPRGRAKAGHVPWIYFHCDLERLVDRLWNYEGPGADRDGDYWTAPDLVSSESPLTVLDDGLYPVRVYGRDAVLFLWRSSTPSYVKGLVALPDDEVGMADARRKFEMRAPIA